MTKRIVSGIFILTALGALGVILAGALTSGEQLIVRFLTAVIVAALGLYVISDLRLQADDDAHTGRTGGANRMGMVDAPPNSTAAFMATVTKKQDTGEHPPVKAETGEQQAVAGGEARSPGNESGRNQRNGPDRAVPVAAGVDQPIQSPPTVDATETLVTKAEPFETAAAAQSKTDAAAGTTRRSVASKRIGTSALSRTTPPGAETVVTPGPDFRPSQDHALAGVGAAVASAAGTGDGAGPDGESSSPSTGGIEPPATEHFQSGSLDISDLFAGRGAGRAPVGDGTHCDGGRYGLDGRPDDSANSEASPVSQTGDDPSATKANGGKTGRNGRNGSVANGGDGADHGNGSSGSGGNFWSSNHISGRLSDSAAAIDPTEIAPSSPFFDPTERVYDITGLESASLDDGPAGQEPAVEEPFSQYADPERSTTEGGRTEDSNPQIPSDGEATTASAFHYSDELQAESYVWPAQPVNELPDPHPFEKASAAYEAAKRQLEEAEDTSAVAATDGSTVVPIGPAQSGETDLAPIIDLRQMPEPAKEEVEAAINAGEVEVIATLIEQGMLSTAGPISDREVRTMVYVAFTSNELRKLLLAGGSPDGPNYGLDLGPVELFDERTHAPAPKRLYAGQPSASPVPSRQLG